MKLSEKLVSFLKIVGKLLGMYIVFLFKMIVKMIFGLTKWMMDSFIRF